MKVKFTYKVPASDFAPELRKKLKVPKEGLINELWWHGPKSFGYGKRWAKEFKNAPSPARLKEMLKEVKKVVTDYKVSVEVIK